MNHDDHQTGDTNTGNYLAPSLPTPTPPLSQATTLYEMSDKYGAFTLKK